MGYIGIYYNAPKAIFDLLKGDYKHQGRSRALLPGESSVWIVVVDELPEVLNPY